MPAPLKRGSRMSRFAQDSMKFVAEGPARTEKCRGREVKLTMSGDDDVCGDAITSCMCGEETRMQHSRVGFTTPVCSSPPMR